MASYDITEKPYTAVVLRSILKLNLNDLILRIHEIETNIVSWSDGIVFIYMDISKSEMNSEREFKGVKTLEEVLYAELPEYKNIIKNELNMACHVVDMSDDPLIAGITEYIKKRELSSEV